MATQSSILAWRIPWRGAWWAIIHGVAKSQTQLSDYLAHKHNLKELIRTNPLLPQPSEIETIIPLYRTRI